MRYFRGWNLISLASQRGESDAFIGGYREKLADDANTRLRGVKETEEQKRNGSEVKRNATGTETPVSNGTYQRELPFVKRAN